MAHLYYIEVSPVASSFTPDRIILLTAAQKIPHCSFLLFLKQEMQNYALAKSVKNKYLYVNLRLLEIFIDKNLHRGGSARECTYCKRGKKKKRALHFFFCF